MPLEPVHVMELDRATSRLELTRVNPTRQFIQATENGMGLYTWQNGCWYDTGGNQITDLSLIPQRFRDEIDQNPIVAGLATGPAVTAVCKHCGEKMNQSEIEQHYIDHLADTMKQIGTAKAEKRDANTHARG